MAADMTKVRQVGILVFPDVEVLDFAGPFEVFAAAGEVLTGTPFRTYTVGTGKQPIAARNGLLLVANYELQTAPPPDILVLPGGSGSRVASQEPLYMDWVRAAGSHAERILTVCTGARFSARLGWLDGVAYTTHHMAFDELRELAPLGRPDPSARFVNGGKLLSAAGVSAGIDASLHLVSEYCGREAAAMVADYMEYPLRPE
jgi:transcriptional regulator GlxA family with amidase domain